MGPTPAKVGRINDRDTQTTGPDPWSIKLEVNPGNYDDGPGISQRAAAARTQTVWRWLVNRKEL